MTRTLIIDNYDSFTFNLFQMIAQVNEEEPIVVYHDEVARRALDELAYDNIVLSPGPGSARRAEDLGICRDALLAARAPILGVCLGHQAIAEVYGGDVRHAPEPMHGRTSRVFHDGSPLWRGIPQGFSGARYHSWMVDERLPADLARTAWTEDGIVMGLRHRGLPIWGVQFHPESIATEHGHRLLANFRDLSRGRAPASVARVAPPRRRVEASGYAVVTRKLALDVDPARVYAEIVRGQKECFWLDSSRAEAGVARFSFMGSASGPHALVVSYDAAAREVTERRGREARRTRESIYEYLARELARRACASRELPFDFNCGFVGYFGYELKVEAGAARRHAPPYPDAAFILADRVVAFDHAQGDVWLVALSAGHERSAAAWMDATERRLHALALAPERARVESARRPVTLRLARSRERYLADVARCMELLRDGESYELCLTNRIELDALGDPLDAYLALRAANPAPYSALLELEGVRVLSSSPERFVRVDRDRWAESKPIKGTRPRGATRDDDARLARDLATSEKDRAENLMIVDLVRNDLGIVCEIGSVHVPALGAVESYETVHQLVSTIRGRLRAELTAVDVVRHAFPGGSMTGAPKLRTMNLLDAIEDAPRGVYSGALGYLALGGAADLSVVIRAIVERPGEGASIGVGGAIVALSDPEAEFEETMVKARALVRALAGDADACDAALRALRETGVATV